VAIQTNNKATYPVAANMRIARDEVNVSGLSIHDNTFTHLGEGTTGYEGIYINRDIGTGDVVLADHIGNTGLRILASPFSIYSMGVR